MITGVLFRAENFDIFSTFSPFAIFNTRQKQSASDPNVPRL